MRRAIHIGLFIGTLIGMCACAVAPTAQGASNAPGMSVALNRAG